jgi:hypothetical protein
VKPPQIVLPGQRLVTSKKPRTLTPSEIELLQQDLKAALKVLGQDEVDDAHALMRGQDFRSEDFENLERAEPSLPALSAVTGMVVVVRRSNKASRIYATGHGSTWLEQFYADLKLGVFGHQK